VSDIAILGNADLTDLEDQQPIAATCRAERRIHLRAPRARNAGEDPTPSKLLAHRLDWWCVAGLRQSHFCSGAAPINPWVALSCRIEDAYPLCHYARVDRDCPRVRAMLRALASYSTSGRETPRLPSGEPRSASGKHEKGEKSEEMAHLGSGEAAVNGSRVASSGGMTRPARGA
jgi:hypothetical protein